MYGLAARRGWLEKWSICQPNREREVREREKKRVKVQPLFCYNDARRSAACKANSIYFPAHEEKKKGFQTNFLSLKFLEKGPLPLNTK